MRRRDCGIHPATSCARGYAVPTQLAEEDIIYLHLALWLMGEFERARYCLKRAGKGGRFVWKDRQRFQFDVELAPNVQRLVDVFDDRATTVGNVLQYYGSWAPAEISHWFPLPEGGAYTLIHPWPRAHVISGISLGHHVPVILTVVKDWLILIEAKAHAGKKDLLLVGDPDRLQERWEKVVQPSVRQADTPANRIAKEPKGKNFEIPHKVNRIVALVCGPFREWIPSADKEWWLYDDIPRVCAPDELLHIISRIQRGQSPNQNVISILRK